MVTWSETEYDTRQCECGRWVEIPLSLALEYDEASESPPCSRCAGDRVWSMSDVRI